jgi:hypothetical protein
MFLRIKEDRSLLNSVVDPDADQSVGSVFFLGLPDPNPSLFCTGLDPDLSISKQKSKKTLVSSIL